MPDSGPCRLVTRNDFDGLVCAVLLKELDLIDDIQFVHPKDMQDGKVPIGANDITTNLPYVPGCRLAFDHHASESLRLGGEARENHVIDPNAPSTARVVYEHFGGASAFPRVSGTMLDAVDRADSAQYTCDEILYPSGWVLLHFLMDARTGLGRFRKLRVSNDRFMLSLIDACRDLDIAEIIKLPDVQERVALYFEQEAFFIEQLLRCATEHGRLVVLDLREEDPIFAGNRFMVYALYPECQVSMHVLWGRERQNTVFAIGKSIVERGASLHAGKLCLEYGGGGHENAGTCQIDNADAPRVQAELIERLSGQAQAGAPKLRAAG